MNTKRLVLSIIIAAVTMVTLQYCGSSGVVKKKAPVYKQGKQLYDQAKYEQAVKQLEPKLEQHPDNAMLRYYLGLAYLQQDKLEKAMSVYEQAANIAENSRMDSVYSAIMAQQAEEYRKAEKYEAVPAWADSAITLDSKNKLAYYEKYMAKGLNLYHQGSKWELWDAIVAFGNATAALPERPMPYYYAAKSYSKKDDKDFENILGQYEKALERDPPPDIEQEINKAIEDLKRRKKLYEDFWGN
ncbi:MAG: tetratricopeptide repeat protein [Candidatus Marinimicrobia bacterium]|nr:tetratricopeptide repeat protein [Candidatus Neomarinimicrobiota bacterium]MCF7827503.1 tetratricopeptide repeat protein [Candidatus Neomarinimicrobiota bacterium]